MKKQEVLKGLQDLIIYHGNNYSKCEQLKKFVKMVKASNLQDYKNIALTKQGHINLGNVAENLVLNYLGLQQEDDEHEVKSLIINTPNVLTNTSVKTIYLLVISKNFEGLYKFDDAQAWNGLRIGAKDLRNYKKQLKKVASCNMVARCKH